MKRRPSAPSGSIRRQRRRNLNRHALRRRKFLQHRQREQRLSLLNGINTDNPDDETASSEPS